MSTTFGVKIPGISEDEILDDVVEVAIRRNGLRWKTSLAIMLPDETPVIPLDNSAQGIYTIGDIKKKIESQNTGS